LCAARAAGGPNAAVSLRAASGLALAALACAATFVPTGAHAQVSGGVTLATDYRLRGVSLTDGRGVVAANVAYDHDSGFYAGGTVVAHDPAYRDARLLGWQGYAGVSGRFSGGGPAWDVGVSRVDMEPYFDRRYSLEYTQAHVGLSQGDVSGRVSVASGYPRKGVETLYAELNGAVRPADAWRLTGHLGFQSRLTERDGRLDERFDMTLGVVRTLSRRAEAQLSWTTLSRRPKPHTTWTRPGLTAALSVYF
jgi:uncharacterized protein (TIGR02001 family)